MMKQEKKGNIALTLVIVISAMLLAGGMNLLMVNIDFTRATVNYRSRQITEIISKSCVEESLFRLKNDVSFTGNFSVPFTNGNCNAAVTNGGTGIKLVAIQATYLDYLNTSNYQINTAVYPYQITKL